MLLRKKPVARPKKRHVVRRRKKPNVLPPWSVRSRQPVVVQRLQQTLVRVPLPVVAPRLRHPKLTLRQHRPLAVVLRHRLMMRRRIPHLRQRLAAVPLRR